MPAYDLTAPYSPKGDQPTAIKQLVQGVNGGKRYQTLLGATGTGKTFIAFQLAWKLFQSRWTLKRDGKQRPNILLSVYIVQGFFISLPLFGPAIARISNAHPCVWYADR